MEKKLKTYTLFIWEELPYTSARLFLIPDSVIDKECRKVINTVHGNYIHENYINEINTEKLSDTKIKLIEDSLKKINTSITVNMNKIKTNVDEKWHRKFLPYELELDKSTINLKNRKISHIIVSGWMD